MRSILLPILFLAALACGSGGGTQVAGGGIGGTGISSGSVTGFGSIFVTGTEWDVDDATIEVDGEPATEAELALGMFGRVEGPISPDRATGVASRVRFDAAVRGVVSGPPLLDGPERLRFTVLGQIVEADEGQTVFAGTTFATLAEDDVLEVSGPVASNGTIRATRIVGLGRFDPGVTEVELKGEVSDLDDDGFAIGTVGITLDDCDGLATDVDDDLVPLENGDLVEVEGLQASADPDAVDACAIRPFTPLAGEFGEDAENVKLQGVIEGFTSLLSAFTVNGVPVNALGAELEPDEESAFGNGVLVEVEGDIEGGVLVADELELQEGEARVAGEVTEAGLAGVGARQLVLLDDGVSRVEIVVPPSTRIEGDDDDGSLALSELAPGDFLEVRGVDLGEGRMRATEIEVEEDDDDGVEVRGRITDVDETVDGGRGIFVLGVFVEMMESTELPDGYSSLTEFLADLSIRGALVEATDDDVDLTTFGVASQVELEDDDSDDDD